MKIKEYSKITFLFNQYTGNFSREFCAYVFGYEYDLQEWVGELTKTARKEIGEDLCEEILECIDLSDDQEHGPDIGELTEFQGDGIGTFGITIKVAHEFMRKGFDVIAVTRAKKASKAIAESWEFARQNIELKQIKIENFEVNKVGGYGYTT